MCSQQAQKDDGTRRHMPGADKSAPPARQPQERTAHGQLPGRRLLSHRWRVLASGEKWPQDTEPSEDGGNSVQADACSNHRQERTGGAQGDHLQGHCRVFQALLEGPGNPA